MKRLVILGGTGFVGRNLARHLKPHFESIQLPSSRLTDITDKNALMSSGIGEGDIVINCAGNKDVVELERSPTMAFRVNAIGAGNVAWYCRQMKASLIHISSDHAYANPRTIYGESKELGDDLVRCELPDAIIAVTGHVYDLDCPWIKWLDDELQAGRKVEAWNLHNSPTYARDLAASILAAAKSQAWGSTINATSMHSMMRFDLFRAYCQANGLDDSLIVHHDEEAPPHYPRSFSQLPLARYPQATQWKTPYEGFCHIKEMQEEHEAYQDFLSVDYE